MEKSTTDSVLRNGTFQHFRYWRFLLVIFFFFLIFRWRAKAKRNQKEWALVPRIFFHATLLHVCERSFPNILNAFWTFYAEFTIHNNMHLLNLFSLFPTRSFSYFRFLPFCNRNVIAFNLNKRHFSYFHVHSFFCFENVSVRDARVRLSRGIQTESAQFQLTAALHDAFIKFNLYWNWCNRHCHLIWSKRRPIDNDDEFHLSSNFNSIYSTKIVITNKSRNDWNDNNNNKCQWLRWQSMWTRKHSSCN